MAGKPPPAKAGISLRRAQVHGTLGRALQEAIRLTELAHDAYKATAALEQFLDSTYFGVDTTVLADFDDPGQAKRIEELFDKLRESRKDVDPYSVMEVLIDAELLHEVVDQATKHELGLTEDAASEAEDARRESRS
jgi:hypothetical protein